MRGARTPSLRPFVVRPPTMWPLAELCPVMRERAVVLVPDANEEENKNRQKRQKTNDKRQTTNDKRQKTSFIIKFPACFAIRDSGAP
jgi:hypothetical protein